MNILEAEDMVKGLPDQVLFQYAQNPPPNIPQFLAVSEVQRRQDMRQRFQAQQAGQQQPTVKDQILQSGIGGTGMAPPISSAPPMAPPAPPAQMYNGGVVRMQAGRTTPAAPSFWERSGLPFLSTPEGSAANRESLSKLFTPRRSQSAIIREAQSLVSQGKSSEAFSLLQREGINPRQAFGENAVVPSAQRPRLGSEVQTSGVAFPTPSATPVESAPTPTAEPAPSSVPGGGIADAGAAMARRPAAGSPLSVSGMAGELWKERTLSEQQQAVIDLIKKQQEEGIPAGIDLEPYRQAALGREKEARDEARRMAIANALMGLGSGLVAGDPAAGMRQATQSVAETMAAGRREAAAERRTAEQLQLEAAQQSRQQKIQQMQFDRESLSTVANIYRDLDKSNQESREKAFQILSQYNATVEGNLARASEQGALDRRAFLSALSSAEEAIEDMLAADMRSSPEEKKTMRETLRERAIRRYGAAIPGINVEKILKAERGESGSSQTSGPRNKPLSSFNR